MPTKSHFIPHVNRPDLTINAIKAAMQDNYLSLGTDELWIIDNSDNKEIKSELRSEFGTDHGIGVYLPDVPLTTAQTMNLMRRFAITADDDFFGFQHNDGQPHAGTVKGLYELAEQYTNEGRRWGVIFSNYDVCCVFNTKAVKEIGEWDWLRFPFYHLDNDYYHRMREAGYETVWSELGCDHLNDASSTIKNDDVRNLVNSLTFPISEKLLIHKWGRKV